MFMLMGLSMAGRVTPMTRFQITLIPGDGFFVACPATDGHSGGNSQFWQDEGLEHNPEPDNQN